MNRWKTTHRRQCDDVYCHTSFGSAALACYMKWNCLIQCIRTVCIQTKGSVQTSLRCNNVESKGLSMPCVSIFSEPSRHIFYHTYGPYHFCSTNKSVCKNIKTRKTPITWRNTCLTFHLVPQPLHLVLYIVFLTSIFTPSSLRLWH